MILIGTDDGIYRWFEGCGWPIFHSLQGRAIVGLDAPGGGEIVAIGRDGAVLETIDNGQSWRAVPLAEGTGSPTAVAVGGDPTMILLASRNPLALALRAIGEPDPPPPGARRDLRALLAGRSRPAAVGGATTVLAPGGKLVRVDPETIRNKGWTPLKAPHVEAPGHSPEVRTLALAAGSPAAWFAALRHLGLFRSTDAGASWSACPGLPARVNAVRPIPGRPGGVVAATADGCWVSADAGQTWEDRGAGLEKHRYLSAVDVKPGEPDVMLAGAAPRGPTTRPPRRIRAWSSRSSRRPTAARPGLTSSAASPISWSTTRSPTSATTRPPPTTWSSRSPRASSG